MKNPVALALCALALASAALAQTSPLVSPEVHADRSVTFRISAPQASEVTFKGDWHDNAMPMVRDAGGIWTLTIAPIPPSTYIYAFTVDGVTMADPVNPAIKLRARTSGSLLQVTSGGPSVQEPADVPHGAVEMNWHRAAALDGDTRAVWVYTPPGYSEETARQYPVLYLLHGSNDRAAGWLDVGNLNFIADNLIAAKRMAPMLIVMPYGHALPFGQRSQGERTNTTAFEDYLLQDVIPLVEGKYRIAPGAENRAIAGFSMGAEQTLHVFFNHLDRFSSAGAFSPANYRAMESRHAALLADPAGTNRKINLLWIACGRQDPGHFPGSEQLATVLTTSNIRHTWRPTDGRHNYAYLRDALVEFLPHLFQR